MLFVPLLLSSALAAPPSFTSDREADATRAATLWRHLTDCTGREATVAATLPITRDDKLPAAIGGWLVGDEGAGATGVTLAWQATIGDLARTLAHAWFGPSLVDEGRAEVAATCAVARFEAADDAERADRAWMPAPLAVDLSALTDVTQATVAPHAGDPAAVAARLVARRALLALAAAGGDDAAYAAGTWDAVAVGLAAAGDGGARVAKALKGGADSQRTAFVDADRDGLTTAIEWIRGTDPDVWDTDGDGWWDGAPAEHPEGARPLPFANRFVCTSKVPPKDVDATIVLTSWLASGEPHTQRIPMTSKTTSFLVPTPPGDAGTGIQLRIEGDTLEDNAVCAEASVGVVLRVDPDLGDLHTRVAAALDDAYARAEQTFGIPLGRIYAELGKGDNQVIQRGSYGENTVRIEVWSEDAAFLDAHGGAGPLADMVMAMQVSGIAGVRYRSPEAMAALFEALHPDLPKRAWFKSARGGVKDWLKRAAKCTDGWKAVLENTCR